MDGVARDSRVEQLGEADFITGAASLAVVSVVKAVTPVATIRRFQRSLAWCP